MTSLLAAALGWWSGGCWISSWSITHKTWYACYSSANIFCQICCRAFEKLYLIWKSDQEFVIDAEFESEKCPYYTACLCSSAHTSNSIQNQSPYPNFFESFPFQQQVKLGFTRACRSIDKLGKKWLKTWQNWSFKLLKLLNLLKHCKMLKLLNFLN